MEGTGDVVEKKTSGKRKEALDYRKILEQRGVIYLSRVPPFMKPNKVRSIFEEFGEITRLYLDEEDKTVRKNRRASGGNGSKQFVEGWIEFKSKSVARRVADSLNNQRVATAKGDFYHDDTWNLKYLKNFKWDYLTEKFAYERREREQRVKASMLQAKRVNSEFAELVDKQKAEKFISERKRKNGSGAESNPKVDSNGSNNGSGGAEESNRKKARTDVVGRMPKKGLSHSVLQKIL